MDEDFKKLKIGIAGLGLIGGSLAKAFRMKAGIVNVSAVDINEDSMKKAFEEGIIVSYSSNIKSLENCDVIYLCVPPGKILEISDEISKWYKGIVTDVAGTKKKIYDYITARHPGLRYIPAHPMAGSERVGYMASDSNLFENAPFIFCKDKSGESISSEENEQDILLLEKLAESVGAIPIEMDVNRHDIAVGMVSHLPHVIAFSLVNLLRESSDETAKHIAAGGFRDITRIASADPELWTDIMCESKDALSSLIGEYINILAGVSKRLEGTEKEKLVCEFAKAKEFRDTMHPAPAKKDEYVQIWVDVEDKPGIIGKIAVMLGDIGINIRNINIQDNREYEGGCMRITLSCYEDAKKAEEIFKINSIKARIIK